MKIVYNNIVNQKGAAMGYYKAVIRIKDSTGCIRYITDVVYANEWNDACMIFKAKYGQMFDSFAQGPTL